MPFQTPAQSGRALNFGRPNPLPVWTKADTTEFVFPNALGWYQIFQVDTLAVTAAITGTVGDGATENEMVAGWTGTNQNTIVITLT